MKTYAETEWEKPFNWELFLKNGRKGRLTEEEKKSAIARSLSWVTCACGNQCAIIPRGYAGSPVDYYLRILGSIFYISIKSENWDKATETLRKIERRSAELLLEIQSANL